MRGVVWDKRRQKWKVRAKGRSLGYFDTVEAAALALQRIDTPQAQEALLDHLFTARWCPLTSAASRY